MITQKWQKPSLQVIGSVEQLTNATFNCQEGMYQKVAGLKDTVICDGVNLTQMMHSPSN